MNLNPNMISKKKVIRNKYKNLVVYLNNQKKIKITVKFKIQN
jgi:hypothetical protein